MSQPRFPCDLPLVQAPMAGVQDGALATAVARAGGLGSLPCAMLTPERLVIELEGLKNAGVDTYNLNFFCHTQPEPDDDRERVWRDTLAPYYAEFGIDAERIKAGPVRQPFSAATLEAIRPFKPPVVSFHFGLPKAAWIEEIRSWGGQVWSSATTVEEGCWLEAQGADVVIAQGVEAGGHRGMFLTKDLATQRPTLELLRNLLQVVAVPVVAAGGLATPAKVAGALDAGAWAVQVGSAYLCCDEATTSPLHRERLRRGGAHITQLTNLFSGRPARGIVNRVMEELGPLSSRVPEFPLASTALAPLRSAAESRGRADFTPLWCGTDSSGCRSVSAAEQTQWLMSMVA